MVGKLDIRAYLTRSVTAMTPTVFAGKSFSALS
jgi:hypothetical protein